MGIPPLDGLYGGRDDDEDRCAARAREFIGRYESGPTGDRYEADEALHNYRAVAGRLSTQEYEDAANEAFDRLSYEHRADLKRALRQQTDGRVDVQNDDPRDLAQATARFRDQEAGGGGLASLFSLGGGKVGDQLLAKVALGGVAAVAMKRVLSRRADRPPELPPAWAKRAPSTARGAVGGGRAGRLGSPAD